MTTTFETQDTGDRAATLNAMATVQSATPTATAQATTVTPVATAAATVHVATPPVRYQSRPGRGVVVAPSLADLQGPTEGMVELPLWLFWSCPGHVFDLGDRDMRSWLYETVLREASSLQDLTAYLDGDTLIALWPDLFLPKGVRQAWEDTHPLLRAAVAATA
jgi:hypothetical protein